MDPEIEPTEPEKTPYEWLDVAKNADANTIRHAYTKLVLQHHPDRGGDKDVFDSINQVCAVQPPVSAWITYGCRRTKS